MKIGRKSPMPSSCLVHGLILTSGISVQLVKASNLPRSSSLHQYHNVHDATTSLVLFGQLELNDGSLLGAGENIRQLELLGTVSAPFQISAALARVGDTNGSSHVIEVDGSSKSQGHLNIGQALADASTRSNAKGAEGGLRL